MNLDCVIAIINIPGVAYAQEFPDTKTSFHKQEKKQLIPAVRTGQKKCFNLFPAYELPFMRLFLQETLEAILDFFVGHSDRICYRD